MTAKLGTNRPTVDERVRPLNQTLSLNRHRVRYARSMPVHEKLSRDQLIYGFRSGVNDRVRICNAQLPKLRTRVRFSSPALNGFVQSPMF